MLSFKESHSYKKFYLFRQTIWGLPEGIYIMLVYTLVKLYFIDVVEIITEKNTPKTLSSCVIYNEDFSFKCVIKKNSKSTIHAL